MNKAQCAFGPPARKMENLENQQREEKDEAKTMMRLLTRQC
jgi:hypothetical protein